MIQPSQQQLDLLSPTERLGYRLADITARRLRASSVAWNSSVLVLITKVLIERRLRVHGLDCVRGLDPARSTLMVANHRSFFDYFAVCCALFRWTQLSRQLLFPVRSNFFYERVLGIAVNGILAGMTMFPPILRNPSKRDFNRYTSQRVIAELSDPRMVVGVHPEGTRNQNPDPFDVRPGKLGIGEMVLGAEHTQILPIFIHGLSNDLTNELRRNWATASEHPIQVSFGPAVDMSDLYSKADDRSAQRCAVDRCTEAIRALAETTRERAQADSTAADTRGQAHR